MPTYLKYQYIFFSSFRIKVESAAGTGCFSAEPDLDEKNLDLDPCEKRLIKNLRQRFAETSQQKLAVAPDFSGPFFSVGGGYLRPFFLYSCKEAVFCIKTYSECHIPFKAPRL